MRQRQTVEDLSYLLQNEGMAATVPSHTRSSDPGSTPPCNLQEHDPAQSLLMFPYVSIRLPEIILRFRNKIYITRKKHLSALTINTTNQYIDFK